MKSIYILIFITFLVGAGPCQNSSSQGPKNLTTRSVLKGDHLDISNESAFFILRSAEDLSLLDAETLKSFPEVDWDKETIIGVASQVPTGGYEVSINKVELLGDQKTVNVYWALKGPPEGSFTTMVVSQPHEFVAVEKQGVTVAPHFIKE